MENRSKNDDKRAFVFGCVLDFVSALSGFFSVFLVVSLINEERTEIFAHVTVS